MKALRNSMRQWPGRSRQRGVVLFIALIVLVAMSLAGIAIMRSVDTGNLIAGNVAFQQGTLASADRGIDDAYNTARIVQRLLERTSDDSFTALPRRVRLCRKAADRRCPCDDL